MSNKEYTEDQLETFVDRLILDLVIPNVVGLKGDLGSGKTTLAKKIIAAYGIEESVTSPTFNIVKEYKGDKISLGYSQKPHPLQLKSHQINLSNNSSFYIFSDGITDQIGGPKNIMYGKKRIINIISNNSYVEKTIFEITKDFESYQQNSKRRDDLSLFGFSIA